MSAYLTVDELATAVEWRVHMRRGKRTRLVAEAERGGPRRSVGVLATQRRVTALATALVLTAGVTPAPAVETPKARTPSPAPTPATTSPVIAATTPAPACSGLAPSSVPVARRTAGPRASPPAQRSRTPGSIP